MTNEKNELMAMVVGEDSDLGKRVMGNPLTPVRGFLGKRVKVHHETARFNAAEIVEVRCSISSGASIFLTVRLLEGLLTEEEDLLYKTAQTHKRELVEKALNAAARLRGMKITMPAEVAGTTEANAP